MNSRTAIRRTLASLVVTLVLVSSAVAFATPATAAAATEPTVSLVPATGEVDVDGTATVDVVVRGAADGIGAYDVTVAVDGRTRITDARVVGGAGFQHVDVADDGSSARVAVAAMNTTADASTAVSIATFTVHGVGDGESRVDLDVTELADDDGTSYQVAGTDSASIRVVGSAADADTGSSGGSSSLDSESDGRDGTDDADVDVDGDAAATDDSDGSADVAADTTAVESEDDSASVATASGREDEPSEETASSAAERPTAADLPTRFGVTLSTDVLDRVVGTLGGPIGVAGVIAVLLLIGVGLRRRR